MIQRLLGALCCALVLPSAAGAAQPAFATDDIGARAANAPTTVVVVLPHRNQADLDALLRNIASGRAHPISRSDFASRFGASPQSFARVTTFLQRTGFTITRKTDALILASAPARTVDATFAVHLHNLRNTAGSDAYAALERPTVPAAIGGDVMAIVVDNLPVHRVR